MIYNCSEKGYCLEYSIEEEHSNSYIVITGAKYSDAEFSKHNTIEIPEKIKGINVSKIAFSSFAKDENIERVIIPGSVKVIGAYAFAGSSIKSVELSPGIEKIQEGAFKGCEELSSINLPEGLKEISSGAFLDCKKITSIKLPDSLERMGTSIFDYCCSLNSIHIGANLQQLGDDSGLADFCFHCNGLKKITTSPLNKHFKAGKNVLYNMDKKFLVKVFGATINDTIVIPEWVNNFCDASFKGVCAKVVIKPSSLPNIEHSDMRDVSVAYCHPKSDICKYLESRNVKTRSLGKDKVDNLNNFLASSENDEKDISKD